jgi:predicted RNA-binding protein YlxR (DUF448 family)
MQRTCVGCRSVAEPSELVRLVVGPEGEVVVDLAGGSFGRGAWVHPRPECLQKAAPAGLSRALRTPVRAQAGELVEKLRSAAARRVQGLIVAARRAHKLEAGATVVAEAVEQRKAELVLVATDARASADFSWLEPLVGNGRALAFGSKALFGSWLGRSDTALLALTDAGIARQAKQAILWTMLGGPHAPTTGARRAVSSEVG